MFAAISTADIALVVSCLALLVTILSYQHTARPRVRIGWKVPRRLRRPGILYCFFEATFTNRGGKPVSLIELNNRGQPLAVISKTIREGSWEEEEIAPYTGKARLFLLTKPVQWYLSHDRVGKIAQETQLTLEEEVALDIRIEAGATYRLALCFEFSPHETITGEATALYVRFRAMLNNGQSAAVGVAADGHPVYYYSDQDFQEIETVGSP